MENIETVQCFGVNNCPSKLTRSSPCDCELDDTIMKVAKLTDNYIVVNIRSSKVKKYVDTVLLNYVQNPDLQERFYCYGIYVE
jgi:hypothetical protein